MRSLPAPMPPTALRSVLRVPQQPYFRFDTNDYSLDPRFAGRRVELTIGPRASTSVQNDRLDNRRLGPMPLFLRSLRIVLNSEGRPTLERLERPALRGVYVGLGRPQKDCGDCLA